MSTETKTPRADVCPHCGAAGKTGMIARAAWECGNATTANQTEFCRERQARQKAEAEVERLKRELAMWDYGTRVKRERARAEKAEAKAEKLGVLIKRLFYASEPSCEETCKCSWRLLEREYSQLAALKEEIK
jgi:hypothetical protein